MIRLGLCCTFLDEPIKFRTTTATYVARLGARERVETLRALAQQNAASLEAAIVWCAAHGVGSFRVNSQILPLWTHPEVGYDSRLVGERARGHFRRCGALARSLGVRLTFHPDQFVVLNSPSDPVVRASVAEIEYQAQVGEWIGADVITVHAGGGYGDPAAALLRLEATLGLLSQRARSRLALENDEKVYGPGDLLPICRRNGIPLIYDVHHHRCRPDGHDTGEITAAAIDTWGGREPLFHLSSPLGGWRSRQPSRHADFIQPRDFPMEWRQLNRVTIEVEAKAKEAAVLRLRRDLLRRRIALWPPVIPTPARDAKSALDTQLR